MAKRIAGTCQHCGMPLQFDAEAIGTVGLCPHCRKHTELMLATPPQESLIPRHAIVWSAIAAVILALGVIGIVTALQRTRKLAGERPPSAATIKTNTPTSHVTPRP